MPDDSAAGLKPVGSSTLSEIDELATTFSYLAVVYRPRTSRTLLEIQMPDDLLYQLFTSILRMPF